MKTAYNIGNPIFESSAAEISPDIQNRTMLPRRGYEPVDSVEENLTRGEVTNESGDGRRSGYASITTGGPSESNAEPRAGRDDGSTSSASNGLDDDSEGSMTVRVLDVQGQTYTLRVRPETRVSELKTRLVEIADVEIARQRIIWSGKVRKRLLRVLFHFTTNIKVYTVYSMYYDVQKYTVVLIIFKTACSSTALYFIVSLLSTWPLHINWFMVTCKMATPVTGTILRTTGPVPADSRQ